MYHWLIQGSGWHQSYQWLGRTEQRCSEHGRKEDRYKTAPETIKHIVARWKMWAGTMYTERRNQVAYSVQEHLWCIEIRSPQAPIEPIWDTTKGDDELKTGRWSSGISSFTQRSSCDQPTRHSCGWEDAEDCRFDSCDNNIRKEEHEKIEKYQGLQEPLKQV